MVTPSALNTTAGGDMVQRFLAAAALLLAALPAQASSTAIRQHLNHLAIRVEHRTCPPAHAGLYYSKLRLIVICVNTTGVDTPLYHETLAHEALHVVHDCQAGVIGDGAMASMAHHLRSTGDGVMAKQLSARIQGNLGPDRVAIVRKLYPSQRVELELEADVLEHSPRWVASFLETCHP